MNDFQLAEWVGETWWAMAGMFALGGALFGSAGYWWGSKRTSGETCAIQDLIKCHENLCHSHNELQAENERLREEVKHGLSID